EQRVALAAGEGEVRVAGQPVHRVAVEDHVRYGLPYPGDEVVAELGEPGGELLAVGDGVLDGHGEGGDRGGVEGAGAHLALLAPAVQHRDRVDAAGEQQRAHPDRAADLVPGE